MITVDIHECDGRKLWPLFAPHHYLTDKYTGIKAFVAVMDGELVGFTSYISLFGFSQPQPARRGHRTVVLPDFQGMGIGMKLSEWLGERCHMDGYRYYSKTSHPRMGEYRNGSPLWRGSVKNGKARSKEEVEYAAVKRNHNMKSQASYSHEYIGSDVDLYAWVMEQRRE